MFTVSESMAPSVSLLVVTSLMVMADTDLTSDMRELRGELEQLRSEVSIFSSDRRSSRNASFRVSILSAQTLKLDALSLFKKTQFRYFIILRAYFLLLLVINDDKRLIYIIIIDAGEAVQ